MFHSNCWAVAAAAAASRLLDCVATVGRLARAQSGRPFKFRGATTNGFSLLLLLGLSLLCIKVKGLTVNE